MMKLYKVFKKLIHYINMIILIWNLGKFTLHNKIIKVQQIYIQKDQSSIWIMLKFLQQQVYCILELEKIFKHFNFQETASQLILKIQKLSQLQVPLSRIRVIMMLHYLNIEQQLFIILIPLNYGTIQECVFLANKNLWQQLHV